MAEQKRKRSARQPHERSDRAMERLDASNDERGSGQRNDPDDPDVLSSAMGGTSDAGTAADDAAESAAFDVGLPDDRTRQTSREREAGVERRVSDRRRPGGTRPDGAGGHGA